MDGRICFYTALNIISSQIILLVLLPFQCRRRCLEIEASLEKFNVAISPLDSDITSPFPVIIGRRPAIAAASKHTQGSLISSICLSQLVANCRSTTSPVTNHQQRPSSCHRDPIFVPSVGWVTQPSPEELQVQFNDGARLVVIYSTATVHSIRYQPPSLNPEGGGDVEEQVYSTASSKTPLPQDVRSRLEVIPKVVRCLRSRSKTPSWKCMCLVDFELSICDMYILISHHIICCFDSEIFMYYK